MMNSALARMKSTPPSSCDVLIIGAGPAGSATALMLTRLCNSMATPPRIVMVETSHFDDGRSGGSIAPDSRPLLEQLGVLSAFMDAGHQVCRGSHDSWGSDAVGFKDFSGHIHGHGWQVERQRFDALLARQAAVRGVAVCLGWRLRDAVAFVDGGYQIELRDDDQQERTLSARIVVDASGQAAAFAHAVGARRTYDDHLVSIAGVFNLAADATIDQYSLREAVPYGWWQCARINAKQAIVSVTSDSGSARQLSLTSLGAWFSQLAHTRHLHKRIHGSVLSIDGLNSWAVPCFHLAPCAGKNWLAVGDAALCHDPIAGHGIDQALATGIAAADAIHKRWRDPRADFSDYALAMEERHRQFMRLRQSLYASEQRWPEQNFWRARQQLRGLVVASAA